MTPADLRTRALAALTPAIGEVTARQALAVLDVHGLTVAPRDGGAAVGDVLLRRKTGAWINGEGEES